ELRSRRDGEQWPEARRLRLTPERERTNEERADHGERQHCHWNYQLTLRVAPLVPGNPYPAVPANSSVPATRAATSARMILVFIFKLLSSRASITVATIVNDVDLPLTFRGHSLTFFKPGAGSCERYTSGWG